MIIKHELGECIILKNEFMRVARAPHILKIAKIDEELAYLSGLEIYR